MAHNRIPLSAVQLYDRWPGAVNEGRSIPTNGWDNTCDNYTTTSANDLPSYPMGTKIMAYTDNSHGPGWYTMMYLMFHDYSSTDISADMTVTGKFCIHYDGSASMVYDNSHSPYYIVTNHVDLTVGQGSDASDGGDRRPTDFYTTRMLAIPCATLDGDGTSADVSANNGYGDAYGWFWVGGVCPCLDATKIDGSLGLGLGAEIECGSEYEGGPLTLDASTSAVFFAPGSQNHRTQVIRTGTAVPGPIVGYGCISGS